MRAARWHARAVHRLGLLASACLLVAPATATAAATDDVSITLTPGAGLLLHGAPALDATGLDLGSLRVLDARGGNHGWDLSADVSGISAGHRWAMRLSEGPDGTLPPLAKLPPRTTAAFVTLTVGPAV